MELAHEIDGSGPLVVLVHGITENRETWRPLVEPLREKYRVLLVDLRGHGESAEGDVYDPITLATDVRETVLSAADTDADNALMVGHSLGGVVVSAYGALFPCRGIINVDQPLRLSAFKEGLSQLEPLLKGDTESFSTAIAMLFGSMMGALPADEVSRVNSLRRPTQSVVLGVWGTVFDSTPEELDAQVDALVGVIREPYLALHGTDPGVDYANWLLDATPTAVFEVWDDLGHYPHLVWPDTFVDRVVEFDAEGI
jgi:pimeloyl-ACP methyl ester carboxylesterase